MAKAYQDYYTHKEGVVETVPEEGRGPVEMMLGRLNLGLLRASGATAEREHVRVSCLGNAPVGRLLEVGCGNGWRLDELRRLGWDVVGQEVDEEAAASARRTYGLPVLTGPLERLGLQESQFDAVVMNHVIEHVQKPVPFLRECWRLVKPKGRLVCVTPNLKSLGHLVFGRTWSGLDAPRHLEVFTPRSLESAATKAGIGDPRCRTSAGGAFGFAFLSMYGHRASTWRPRRISFRRAEFLATLVQHLATAVRVVAPSSGDECVLWAVK